MYRGGFWQTLVTVASAIAAVATLGTALRDIGELTGRDFLLAVKGIATKEIKPDDRADAFKLFDDLKRTNDDVLFVLKSADDPCQLKGPLNCRGLPGDKVKPFLEAAIAYRQAENSSAASLRSLWVALGALFVSCCSMAISYMNFRRS
jgi:hypothetical protein